MQNLERIISRHRQQLAVLSSEHNLNLTAAETEQVLAELRSVLMGRVECLNGHPALNTIGGD